MQRFHTTLTAGFLIAAALTNQAHASGVSLGGLMNHVNINVDAPVGGQFPLAITIDDDPGLEGLDMVLGAAGLDAPFDILTDKAYNAQFGWLAQGRWGPGIGEGAFIEVLEQSQGLSTYQGGLSVDFGGDGISDDLNGAHTLAPIFGTDGSPDWWRWDGRMTHNWYVSDQQGDHFARYRVFVAQVLGDGSYGDLSSTFLPTEVTLRWNDSVSLPEPSMAMALVGLVFLRPRRKA